MDTPPYGGLDLMGSDSIHLVSKGAMNQTSDAQLIRAKTHEEIQQQLQRELERELEQQFAAQMRPLVKQEIRIGSESVPTIAVAESQVPKPSGDAASRIAQVSKVQTAAQPETGKKRVNVDDPMVPQEQVIAQLKADLAEAQARKEAEQAVMLCLARKEAQVLELKKRLAVLMAPKKEPPGAPVGVYNPLLTDPLLIATLQKQCREIQRLRDEMDRERSQNAHRPHELPSHTALRLIAKAQELQKENSQLSQALESGYIANNWVLLAILKHEADQSKAALNAAIAQAQKTYQDLRETQIHQQKIELALQKLLKSNNAVKEEPKASPFVYQPILPPTNLHLVPQQGIASGPALASPTHPDAQRLQRERKGEARDRTDQRPEPSGREKGLPRSSSPKHAVKRHQKYAEGHPSEATEKDLKRSRRES